MNRSVTWLFVDHSAIAGGGMSEFPRIVDAAAEDKLLHLGLPATTTSSALARVSNESPDVLLLDLKMPREPGTPRNRSFGVECAEAVAALPNAPKVVVFSNDPPDPSSPGDRALIARLGNAGVAGYMTRDVPARDVARAMLDAVSGLPAFREPDVLDAWNRCIATPHVCFGDTVRMTPAQHRVMVHAYRTKLPSKKLAEQLHLSVDAVDSHLAEAGKRTGHWPRPALMIWARNNCSQCGDFPTTGGPDPEIATSTAD